MIALIERLAVDLPGIAPDLVASPKSSMYRIYRDTRFSANKAPYKTHVAAIFPHRALPKHEGAGLYVHVATDQVFVGGGLYRPQPRQLHRLREHVAANSERLRALAAAPAFRRNFGELSGERLKRVPRGFAADHPAGDSAPPQAVPRRLRTAGGVRDRPGLLPFPSTTLLAPGATDGLSERTAGDTGVPPGGNFAGRPSVQVSELDSQGGLPMSRLLSFVFVCATFTFLASCDLALLSTRVLGERHSADELFEWQGRIAAGQHVEIEGVSGTIYRRAVDERPGRGDRRPSRGEERPQRGSHRSGGASGRRDDLRGLPAGRQRVSPGETMDD